MTTTTNDEINPDIDVEKMLSSMSRAERRRLWKEYNRQEDYRNTGFNEENIRYKPKKIKGKTYDRNNSSSGSA